MNKNILLCGVGGQGTVLASKLLAAAAMSKGYDVLTAETIGMAQRGGSVTSHVRIGDGVYSPLIGHGQADIIVGFEPGEAVRMLPYLKENGVVIVSKHLVKPVTGTLSGTDYTGGEMVKYLKSKVENVIVVDTDKTATELGSSKVLNVVLLGAVVECGILDISKDDIKKAICDKVAPKFHELNIRAVDYIKIEDK